MALFRRKGQITIRGEVPQAPDTPPSDLEMARIRLLIVAIFFLFVWCGIAVRLGMLTFMSVESDPQPAPRTTSAPTTIALRSSIVDRNGELLATSLSTASLFADPRKILDATEAAEKLAALFPDLDRDDILEKLQGQKHFVWLKRNLTPRQQADVLELGIPGIDFQKEKKRVYPAANLTAHIIGYTDIDGNGIAGVEKTFNQRLSTNTDPLKLSVDLRVQSILHDEIRKAIVRFSAIGGTGLVMDARTGEILALASLPDFDPHDPGKTDDDAHFNRATLGVYEMGSTFKMFTAASALESGRVLPSDYFDARKPLHVGRFTISDTHPENRWLSLPEVIMYSSNVGAAQIGLQTGTRTFHSYLDALGLTRPSPLELPEVGAPLVPSNWRDINTMTIAFGHGLAVSSVQLASAFAAVIGDGALHPPTIVAGKTPETPVSRIFSDRTVSIMRKIARLVVEQGTGKQASVEGYVVGGKTGTAEKTLGRGYNTKANLSSFIAAFPMQDPRYVIVVAIDEPKGIKETYGFTTGGWVAATAVKQIIARMAPLMGIRPFDENDPAIQSAVHIDPVPQNGGRQLVVF